MNDGNEILFLPPNIISNVYENGNCVSVIDIIWFNVDINIFAPKINFKNLMRSKRCNYNELSFVIQ